jgi:hypothetical protein
MAGCSLLRREQPVRPPLLNARSDTHSLKTDKTLEELEKRTPLSPDPQQELEGRNSKLDTGCVEEHPSVGIYEPIGICYYSTCIDKAQETYLLDQGNNCFGKRIARVQVLVVVVVIIVIAV